MEKKIEKIIPAVKPCEPCDPVVKPCDYFVVSVQKSSSVPPQHVVCTTSVSLGKTVGSILDTNLFAICVISRGSRPE